MTREEAIKHFKEQLDIFGGEHAEAIKVAIEALQADTVEVVRCKDCRWYENRYGEVCHNPRYGDGHANYSPPYVDGEYFCKDGERNEEWTKKK